MPLHNENINNLEKLSEFSIDLVLPILTQISLEVIQQVRNPKKTHVTTSFQNSKPFLDLTEKLLTTGYFYGQFRQQEEIRLQIEEKIINFADESSFLFESGFEGAKEFFLEKKVMNIKEFNALTKDAKATAFSVARIADLKVTEHLKNLIVKAIDDGLSLREYQIQVVEMVQKTGITPLNPYYVENIFRTNLLSTYNIGHRRSGLDDDNAIAFRFVAVGDSRTRPSHQELDGVTEKKNDPIWNQITPPLDYLCRCTIISLSQYYIDNKKGFKFVDTTRKKALSAVGENFRNAPDTMAGYNQTLQKMVREKEAA